MGMALPDRVCSPTPLQSLVLRGEVGDGDGRRRFNLLAGAASVAAPWFAQPPVMGKIEEMERGLRGNFGKTATICTLRLML